MIGPYDTDTAFRAALTQRLNSDAAAAGINVDRLQRRVLAERLLTRLATSQPGQWVLKGGMALEVRLGAGARATRDVDLGLRLDPPSVDAAADLLAEALATDLADGFRFRITKVDTMALDAAGDICRISVTADLAGRTWGAIKVDVGIRNYELARTEQLDLPDLLQFAGIAPGRIEAVSLPRHVAEKFHGMLKTFEGRDNSRTRDLVDVVHLDQLGLIDLAATAEALAEVFAERDTPLPRTLPRLPASWQAPYEQITAEHHIEPSSFPEAVAIAEALWMRLVRQEP